MREGFELERADAGERGADFDEVSVLVRCRLAADEDGFVGQQLVRRTAGGVEVRDVEDVLLRGLRGGLRERAFPLGLTGSGIAREFGEAVRDRREATQNGGALAGGCGVGQLHRRPAKLDRAGDFGIGAVSFEFRVVKEREEAVVVALRERVVFVVVALGAFERGAEPDHAERVDAVVDLVHASFLRVGAGLDVRGCAAVETGGNALRLGGVRQQVASELLDGELREWHVGIERVHDPIAIRPKVAEVIALEAVRVGVARVVEPRPRPADAELRRSQELVHEALNGRVLTFTPAHFLTCAPGR